jgi:PBSX family phage terminase large subunit
MILTPKQQIGWKMLNGPATRILFDGGARSGKTQLVLSWLIHMCQTHKGLKCIAARLHLDHAKNTLYEASLKEMIEGTGIVWMEQKANLICPNGSMIQIRGLDDDERIDRVLGTEYCYAFLNECTQISKSAMEVVASRLAQNVDGLHQKMIFDCNPRSPVHWLYKMGVLHVDPETNKPLPDIELWDRLKWTPMDNPHLNATYIASLNALSGAARRRMLLGEWCQSEGLVYPEFNEDVHIFHRDCSLATFHVVAIDTGFKDPTVLSLWAVFKDQEGLSIHLQELRYTPGRLLDHSIGEMMEVWRGLSPIVVVDPSSSGTLVELGTKGWNVSPAKNKLITGIQVMSDMIKSARLTVEPSCKKMMLEEIYSYTLDPDTDLPAGGTPDHLLDATRYACMAVQGERELVARPYVPELDDPFYHKPQEPDFEEGWVQ